MKILYRKIIAFRYNLFNFRQKKTNHASTLRRVRCKERELCKHLQQIKCLVGMYIDSTLY